MSRSIDELAKDLEEKAKKLHEQLLTIVEIQMESSNWEHVTSSLKEAVRTSEEIDAVLSKVKGGGK